MIFIPKTRMYMQLNSEQVELINSFLVKNDVIFDDIRYEIIDHIASDIEQNYQDLEFYEATRIVLKKWETQIKLSESIWVTTWASFPVIILKKLKSMLMPYSIMACVVFFFSILFSEYGLRVVDIIVLYKNELLIAYCVWLLMTLFFGLKMFFTKPYTTYKYANNRILYSIWISTIIFCVSNSIDRVILALLCINVFSSFFLIQNYKAHTRFLRLNY